MNTILKFSIILCFVINFFIINSRSQENSKEIHGSVVTYFDLLDHLTPTQLMPSEIKFYGSGTRLTQNTFLTNAHLIYNDQSDEDYKNYKKTPKKVVFHTSDGLDIVCDKYYVEEDFLKSPTVQLNSYDYALLYSSTIAPEDKLIDYNFCFLKDDIFDVTYNCLHDFNAIATSKDENNVKSINARIICRLVGFKHSEPTKDVVKHHSHTIISACANEEHSRKNHQFFAHQCNMEDANLTNFKGFSGANIHLIDSSTLYNNLFIIGIHAYGYAFSLKKNKDTNTISNILSETLYSLIKIFKKANTPNDYMGIGIKITNNIYSKLKSWHHAFLKQDLWNKRSIDNRYPRIDKNQITSWYPVLLNIVCDEDAPFIKDFLNVLVQILQQNNEYNMNNLIHYFSISAHHSKINAFQNILNPLLTDATPFKTYPSSDEMAHHQPLFPNPQSIDKTLDTLSFFSKKQAESAYLIINIGIGMNTEDFCDKINEYLNDGHLYYPVRYLQNNNLHLMEYNRSIEEEAQYIADLLIQNHTYLYITEEKH